MVRRAHERKRRQREGGWGMKRGRAAARVRRRALAVALMLAVFTAAVAPVAPGSVGQASAQAGSGVIVHSADGVLLRAEPAYGAEVLSTMAEGTSVGLRTDVADTVYDADGVTQWWPVSAGDADGWVAGFYLDIDGFTQAPAAAESSEAPSKIADFFEAGSYVLADTDDGSGINIRADGAPDAERIGIVPENDVVQVMEGPYHDPIGNPWYMITDGEVTGFVAGWYLARADQPGEDLANSEIPSKVNVPGLVSGAFDYPLQSWVFTQSFGCSPYWFEPWDSSVGCNYHNGIDLAAPAYTPLLAADGGTIEYSGWCDCGLGYYVKIDHGNGFKTLYGHMAEPPWVAPGDAISKGDVIGPVGSTGISTGPHVHFIVEVDGVAQDPLGYLP